MTLIHDKCVIDCTTLGRVARRCQIWQILPKITLPKKLTDFCWQYFLCQKFAIFEKLIVTIDINKIYQINTKTLETQLR